MSSLPQMTTMVSGDNSILPNHSTNNSARMSPTETAAESSNKRPLMTHTKDGQMLSEKKLRRLEKNRLSARECRRRKREATENIQHQINSLEAENLQLRLQLQIGQEAESCINDQQSKASQEIQELLQSGASEADVQATLEEFKEKYADYGKSRRSSIEFHLRQMGRLLKPTQTTSLIMHAMDGGLNTPQVTSSTSSQAENLQGKIYSTQDHPSQNFEPNLIFELGTAQPPPPPPPAVASMPLLFDPKAFEVAAGVPIPPNASSTSRSLFSYLVEYLQVNQQQAQILKDSRFVACEMDEILEQAMSLLAELRDRLTQTGDNLENEFNNIRSILTPTQAAKFLVWVANNDAAIHMLNELWDRVYPSSSEDPTGTDSPV